MWNVDALSDVWQGEETMSMIRISDRLDPTLKPDLRIAAREDGRSVASYVARVLRSHLDAVKMGRKKI